MPGFTEKSILLMDINSHIHRAYHGALRQELEKRPVAYHNGKPVYAIKEALRLIENDIRYLGVSVDYIACVLDSEAKNFRYDIYPEYKANRPPSDAEFNFMRNCIFKLLFLKGYFLLREDGVEADDVIAAMALQAQAIGLNVYISTGDKDFYQLIGRGLSVYNGKLRKHFTAATVKEKFNIEPHQMLDYLTLCGDEPDNIIGVPKCGAKTAAALLANHTLDQLLDDPTLLEGIKFTNRPVITDYIREQAENLRFMRDLMDLRKPHWAIRDDISLVSMIKKAPDTEAVNRAFATLGLRP